jgi:hypothetical protein
MFRLAAGDGAHETLQEADSAAEAGVLFPAEAEAASVAAQGPLTSEAHAFSSAATAASSGQGLERRVAKRRGRRRRYPPAAE